MYLHDVPIVTYIKEIKYRALYMLYSLLVTSISCYYYKEEIFYIISLPLGHTFIYTDVVEAFITYLKLSIFLGLYFSYPLITYQVWCFFLPGLFLYEKKLIRVFILISNILYYIASILGHYMLFPTAFIFFQSFQRKGYDKILNIELQAKIQEYILFNIKMIYGLSICFQLPMALLFIWFLNKQIYLWFVGKRRVIYIFSFVIAAILSPPDILSQFIIAMPLLVFFELSVFTIKLIDIYNSKMETIGIEPTTLCMQSIRSTNRAASPIKKT